MFCAHLLQGYEDAARAVADRHDEQSSGLFLRSCGLRLVRRVGALCPVGGLLSMARPFGHGGVLSLALGGVLAQGLLAASLGLLLALLGAGLRAVGAAPGGVARVAAGRPPLTPKLPRRRRRLG